MAWSRMNFTFRYTIYVAADHIIRLGGSLFGDPCCMHIFGVIQYIKVET